MNREIKCRAWHIYRRCWVYYTTEDLIYRRVFNADRGESYPVEDASHLEKECRYTGLKDRNGVEIYEGDIASFWQLEPPRKDKAKRRYYHPVVKWGADNAGFYGYVADRMVQPVGVIALHEVIGNIYENPDLLESVK